MFPLMTELPLTSTQVASAIRLMLHIAHVDGAGTAEEVALIRQFHESCRGDDAVDIPSFEAIEKGEAGDMPSADDFPDEGHRDMIVALGLMVAYADGEFSPAEHAAVVEAAGRLGVSEGRIEEILAVVKDAMLAQLAGLPDSDSVAVVAKELG